ncbi:MAG: hypothetical protein FWF59_07875 [Turicibacter sp.]|nr:hypothetical protein [Turicibacter sp.]
MNDILVNYYYQQALKEATNGNITHALQTLQKSMECGNQILSGRDAKILAGLCNYRLGQYEACRPFVDDLSQAGILTVNDLDALAKEREAINQLIDQKKYRRAIRRLEKNPEKNVMEFCYLTCLHGILGHKQKAIQAATRILAIDKGNQLALDYLDGLSEMKMRWSF